MHNIESNSIRALEYLDFEIQLNLNELFKSTGRRYGMVLFSLMNFKKRMKNQENVKH